MDFLIGILHFNANELDTLFGLRQARKDSPGVQQVILCIQALTLVKTTPLLDKSTYVAGRKVCRKSW